MKIDLSHYDVVVFDLDDTLYDEIDFVESGYLFLAQQIQRLYDESTDHFFLDCLKDRQPDVIGKVLSQFNLPSCLKSDLINVYRYHMPSISVNSSVRSLLGRLSQKKIPMFIITDGRSFTQRQKLFALDIIDYFEEVYISEEIGVGKPDLRSFKEIDKQFPNSKKVYIGDNPTKDFIAPRLLEWSTIGILNLQKRIHSLCDNYKLSADIWVEHITDLSC